MTSRPGGEGGGAPLAGIDTAIAVRTPGAGAAWWLLVALALVALGLALPRFVIVDGLDRYRGDPLQRSVASLAYEGAWYLNDHPVGRVLLPAARVEEVRREPGSCPPGEPGADRETAEYTARVRFYTLFAVPGPSVRVTCGGWSRRWARLVP